MIPRTYAADLAEVAGPGVAAAGRAMCYRRQVGRLKKVLKWAGIVVGILVLALGITLAVAHEGRPEGARPGPEAEALAERMEQAVDVEAWASTGAVRWTFAGVNAHLWDRRRHVARVRTGDTEALLHVGGPHGAAFRAGRRVHGEEAREILEAAHAAWVNDSFWLNPIAKLRDDGVVRERLSEDALLVRYTSGGLTPGDAYLWTLGEDGTPTRWKLWVSILPIGGVETTWEGWRSLSTGARVSTRHRGPLGLTLELTDVEGAATLEDLVDGPDPFAPLFAEGD